MLLLRLALTQPKQMVDNYSYYLVQSCIWLRLVCWMYHAEYWRLQPNSTIKGSGYQMYRMYQVFGPRLIAMDVMRQNVANLRTLCKISTSSIQEWVCSTEKHDCTSSCTKASKANSYIINTYSFISFLLYNLNNQICWISSNFEINRIW